MTKTLVANTGMDALTHALEAYVSKAKNQITDAVAIKSIEMTVANLFESFEGEKQSSKDMHIAQCLAAMAFSNAILGIVHSMRLGLKGATADELVQSLTEVNF